MSVRPSVPPPRSFPSSRDGVVEEEQGVGPEGGQIAVKSGVEFLLNQIQIHQNFDAAEVAGAQRLCGVEPGEKGEGRKGREEAFKEDKKGGRYDIEKRYAKRTRGRRKKDPQITSSKVLGNHKSR